MVSLTGAMRVTESDFERLSDDLPPVILLYIEYEQPELGMLLERGIVRLAVVPRPHTAVTARGVPDSPEEWLANYFNVMTSPSPPM